ncbi:unnamed protein product [Spirodela intermedia]|uniref:Uncharacterized protein n=1 Tax=Spirodela intermedia TaxID=51605 RepID=A0A7I8ITL1_SPIIN|nr:unnamed protein product [Spirodela intermedia]CAA6661334.1 unnamed protein product [Spirodela intermedia]
MAPTRKPRIISPRFKHGEESPDKDGCNTNKTRQKKLSDMLGSQWSKEELERFYVAYRKHGKDWKKVAGVIRNRTVDMVEALYNMNRAYLSLPEGTATVAGLIAMMTDHYNILEGSDSDDESNDELQTSNKPPKRARGKLHPNACKGSTTSYPDLLQYQSTTTNYGCLSLLKKKRSGGSRPRAVGKRTPRFPVSYTYDREAMNMLSPSKLVKSERDADEDGVHVAALALAEASQRAGSPQVSRTPLRTEHSKSSPVQSGERKHVELEASNSRFNALWKDSYGSEGSLGSVEAETGDFALETGYHHDSENGHTLETKRKVRKSKGKNPKTSGIESNMLDDDVREACSGTEEGPSNRASKAEIDSEVSDRKIAQSFQGPRKRNRQLFSGDESTALDALQTLADLSFNILLPGSAVESESSVQPKEDKKSVDVVEKFALPEVTTKGRKDKTKVSNKKVGPLFSTRKTSKQRELSPDAKISSEAKNTNHQPVRRIRKKPLKPGLAKNPKDEENEDTCPTESPVQERALVQELKPSALVQEDHSDIYVHAASDKAIDVKAKLSHCLSSPLLRRWCMFEWFYSAIDYPWFAKSEFVEYLDHVGLGHVPRLTRVEWGVIRSSLGKPRRLSGQFLNEERDKLEQYRESVRIHYTELRGGIREGLPTDLARPLSVGQRVIACHPKTREIHDGSILTVDRSRCRVQFDRPELGVEFVMDIDCMPLNPSENMPDALRRKNLVVDKISEDRRFGESLRLLSGENVENAEGICNVSSSNYPMSTLMKQANGDTIDAIAVAKAAANEVVVAAQQAMYAQPCTLAQIQAREADIRALAELTRALDKKEALLIELRNMNEEVSAKQRGGESIKEFEHFRKQYAMVLLQLRDANDQESCIHGTKVAAALVFLRQRNTYQGNAAPSWPKPSENSVGPTGNQGSLGHSSFPCQDPGTHVLDIIEGSRRKAKAMVDIAMTAMSSIKEGEDAFARIGEALDSAKVWQSGADPSVFSAKSVPLLESAGRGGSAFQDQAVKLEPSALQASSPKPNSSSNGAESWVPNELISSCVATLLMIQTCTERQDPPAEVAQILDSAVTTLEPCCPQNLPIYREIEVFMGIVKNQMLAKVPTLTSSLPLPRSSPSYNVSPGRSSLSLSLSLSLSHIFAYLLEGGGSKYSYPIKAGELPGATPPLSLSLSPLRVYSMRPRPYKWSTVI